MLSKPVYGWTEFQLEGTSVYSLSGLDDIALEWVEQAIHGLETMLPFTVKGFLEPDRFLCTVSYWNCHIVCEDDESYPLDKEDIVNEFSHTSMLQFCRYLYEDVNQNIDEWARFCVYGNLCAEKKEKELRERLSYLKGLISEREESFKKCFL